MKNTLYFTLLMFVLAGCIERYDAKIDKNESILVVEGIITGGTTQIKLSKSVGLNVPSFEDLITVDHASVYVDCDDGTRSFVAYSSGNGVYQISTGELNVDAKYRLVINVNDAVYQSDFVSPTITSPVNVSFTSDDKDILVCVTTLGNDDQIGYYLWSIQENWEIHSYVQGPYVLFRIATNFSGGIYSPISQAKMEEEVANLISAGWEIIEIGTDSRGRLTGYVRVVNNLYSPNNKYYCWGTDSSKIFITGTTDKLIDNDIREKKIFSFPRTDDRTSVLYRVQVTQNRIHKEAYDYYTNVLKNMKQTGSIFAPIPSEITGNIKCISNPDIPVIGYVDVSTTSMEDIQYLDNKFWDPSLRSSRCTHCLNEITPPLNFVMSRLGSGWVIYTFMPALYILEYCVDCTKIGGKKIKPENWPTDNQ